MKVKLFSTNYMPEQEKYARFTAFENELNDFISKVKVIDIKYSSSIGMCHDAQTHVNEYMEDFSALVMYEDAVADAPAKKSSSATKKTLQQKRKLLRRNDLCPT